MEDDEITIRAAVNTKQPYHRRLVGTVEHTGVDYYFYIQYLPSIGAYSAEHVSGALMVDSSEIYWEISILLAERYGVELLTGVDYQVTITHECTKYTFIVSWSRSSHSLTAIFMDENNSNLLVPKETRDALWIGLSEITGGEILEIVDVYIHDVASLPEGIIDLAIGWNEEEGAHFAQPATSKEFTLSPESMKALQLYLDEVHAVHRIQNIKCDEYHKTVKAVLAQIKNPPEVSWSSRDRLTILIT